jgi:hypothetical protein
MRPHIIQVNGTGSDAGTRRMTNASQTMQWNSTIRMGSDAGTGSLAGSDMGRPS